MKSRDIERIPINFDLLKLITPQGIELKSSRVQMGEILSRLFYISGFPSEVNPGWASNLKEIPNTTICYIVNPIEDVQAYVNGVSKGMTTDKNTYNTSQNEVLRTQALYKIKHAEKIIEDITINNIPYIRLGILLKSSSDTEQGFQDNNRQVINKIAGMGLKMRVPAFLQEKALKECSPFDTTYQDIDKSANKDMSLMSFIGGLPLSGSGLIDEQGYYLGTDEDGRMIAISFFNKGQDRTNSNIVIEGSSGSGKSFLAKKIMLNEWLNGTKFFIIDPESEYRPLCKLLGGKWIDCSGGYGEYVGRINPLQINPIAEVSFDDEDSEEYTSKKSPLALHLDFLSTFFKLYYPEITSLQESLLMEILEDLYKDFNINYETNISNIKEEDFPIMEDLYKMLCIRADTEEKHPKEIEELRAIIRGLAIGNYKELFNGHTTIKFDSDFICLDVYSLQGASENIKRCQYFNILRYCQDQAFKDRNERCFVVCDEAYLLIDKKVPQSIEFMRNFTKRARKFECGLITITQSLVDFLAPEIKQYGQAILDNSAYKFFFGLDGKDLEEVSKVFNFNKEEKAIVSQRDRGYGLLRVSSSNMAIRVRALEWELPYLVGGGR
ncbi:MAG: ATP-binding protein [Clostridia bacterium]|nr:ATP-binding protein [Clostridia bacterium]